MLSTVWCLVLAGALLDVRLVPLAAPISWALAALLLLATRSGRAPSRGGLLPALVGALAGYASLPAWVASISIVGLWIGLEPLRDAPHPLTLERVWIGVLCAPIVEELLYRERVLAALVPCVGSLAAVFATSALFALPHLGSWSILGTFLVGLALGTLAAAGGAVSICIGIHAGLNLALLAGGASLPASALPPFAAGGVGALLTLLALLLSDPIRWRRRV